MTNTDQPNRGSSQSITEVIPKLFWPMVFVIAILLFRSQIVGVFDYAINGGGASVEVPGGFKLNLPSKSSLPSPPASIKAILPELDPEMIDSIMANIGQGRTLDICYHQTNPDDFEGGSARSRMKKLGMINFDRVDQIENGKPCEAGSRTTYRNLYDETKDYLIAVLKTVKFVPTEKR